MEFQSFKFNLKRVLLDLSMVISVLLLILFIPSQELAEANPKIGFFSIFLSKLIYISAGILHAHLTRKLIWNYIDFNKETYWPKSIMIVAWYVVIVWSWARGG